MKGLFTKIIILAVLCGGGSLVSFYLYMEDEKRIGESFQRDVIKFATRFDDELKKNKMALSHLKKFFESVNSVDADMFHYVASEIIANVPAMGLIGWAPLVLPHQRLKFEEKIRFLNPDFQINELATQFEERGWDHPLTTTQNTGVTFGPEILQPAQLRPFAFPVIAMEPVDSPLSSILVGLDIMGIPNIAVDDSIMAMIQGGKIIAIPPIASPFTRKHEPVLVTIAPVMTQQSSFLDMPIYARGLILTSFSVEDFLAGIIVSDLPENISLLLVDETDDGGLNELYSYGNVIERKKYKLTVPITTGLGRNWVLRAQATDVYIETQRSPLPLTILLCCYAGAVGLILYINALQHRSWAIENLVAKRTVELQSANVKLAELTRQDGLTGIGNRRHFDEMLRDEWRQAFGGKTELTVVLVDIDFFKNYNDLYGHQMGDECLRRVALELKETFKRATDIVTRYGGEEFGIVLRNTKEEATALAEKACRDILELKIEHGDSAVSEYVTISVGVSRLIPTTDTYPEYLLDCADKGLYEAKEQGRNCTIYYNSHSETNKIANVSKLTS